MAWAIPADLPVVVEQSRHAAGREWLTRLPSLIGAALQRWDLVVAGEPFRDGSAAWAAPVERRDGAHAVLKITLPHREARYEGEGLRVWAGEGSVELYEEDADSFALLIERCRPGTSLARDRSSSDERLRTAAGILVRLWNAPVSPSAPFETVDDVCAEWADGVRRRMDQFQPGFDPGLVEIGARLLESLPASTRRRVLVHGDFNPTNILRAEREPWLAIDAKPMVGDPGYDLLPLVAQVDELSYGSPRPDRLRHGFDLVADVVGEPVDRLLAWAAARTVEAALWHVSRGEVGQGADTMVTARVLADLGAV